jgi:flagellar biosynthesis/type III secretory pathway protein FliH
MNKTSNNQSGDGFIAEDKPAVECFNDPEWMQKTLDDLDENLESVTDELKHSYTKLAAGVARIDKEIDQAFAAGDEMAYNAAKIKKNMILERLRELEALQL